MAGGGTKLIDSGNFIQSCAAALQPLPLSKGGWGGKERKGLRDLKTLTNFSPSHRNGGSKDLCILKLGLRKLYSCVLSL